MKKETAHSSDTVTTESTSTRYHPKTGSTSPRDSHESVKSFHLSNIQTLSRAVAEHVLYKNTYLLHIPKLPHHCHLHSPHNHHKQQYVKCMTQTTSTGIHSSGFRRGCLDTATFHHIPTTYLRHTVVSCKIVCFPIVSHSHTCSHQAI
jgi:hypothetical protein